MQILCFIGNKKPPCGVDLQGGMLYRRDYVGCRTAAEHLSLSSLQRYKENLIFADTILLNIWQSCILFCSKSDTILLKYRHTDTILTFCGLPSISSSRDLGDHTGQSSDAGTWPRLPPISIRLFPYTNNADHPKLLQADPQERGSKQHNERRRGGGHGRGAALAPRPQYPQKFRQIILTNNLAGESLPPKYY